MGQQGGRYNLTLRQDDPFERRLGRCLDRMPKGYAKQFIVRTARLFARQAKDDDELYNLMMDFVLDVKPNRLAELPRVSEGDAAPAPPVQPILPFIAAAAPAARVDDGEDELAL